MSGPDKLAQIEERATFVRSFIDVDTDQAGGFLDELSADVLALVEIARAAQDIAAYAGEKGPYAMVRLDEIQDVAAALSRLDGET